MLIAVAFAAFGFCFVYGEVWVLDGCLTLHLVLACLHASLCRPLVLLGYGLLWGVWVLLVSLC